MGRESDKSQEDKNKMSRDKMDRTEADREEAGKNREVGDAEDKDEAEKNKTAREEVRKKYGIRAGLCAFLLLLLWMIASDVYKMLPGFYENVIRVGVFSDSYWKVQNGYSYQILEDAIAEFEKQHPGTRVEYVSGIIREDYSEWLSEQMMRGTAPDIFFVPGEHFNDFAEAGVLMDLTRLIEEDGEFSPERYYTSAYAYGNYEGVQYALPYECAPKLMFVNKSILEQEGIGMPGNEWTWEDFYRICREVTKDTDRNGIIDQFGVVGYTWEDAFDSNGVTLFDKKGTECYLTDERAKAGISFIGKLEELNGGYSISNKEFALGNVAFQPMLFSEYRAYKSYPLSIKKYSGFEWDCLTMPAGPEGRNISRLDTLTLSMSRSTIHKQEAWELMKLLTGDGKIQSEIFRYSEGVSVLREVVESEENQGFLTRNPDTGNAPGLFLLSDAVEQAVVTARFHDYDRAVGEADRAVRSILEGSSNINMETIIQNRKVNRYLKEMQ